MSVSAIWEGMFAGLALLSLALLAWQWIAGRRTEFKRGSTPAIGQPLEEGKLPSVTLFKPMKGVESATASCVESWLAQDYPGPLRILFGVASLNDPAWKLVSDLIERRRDAEGVSGEIDLVLTDRAVGSNGKVSTLVQLSWAAVGEVWIISDADVEVESGVVRRLVHELADGSAGVVSCFYQLRNSSNLAMRWEAIAVNADFWSQVRQAMMLGPAKFALGAVMAVRREVMESIGGFEALKDYLADDYQLGKKAREAGYQVRVAPVVVDCRPDSAGWKEVWRHQLRWARTIRVCQPAPYFFSILSNATLWPLLWIVMAPGLWSAIFFGCAMGLRMMATGDLGARFTGRKEMWRFVWLAPVKDILQCALWVAAFLGNEVEWRGTRYRIHRGGRMERV